MAEGSNETSFGFKPNSITFIEVIDDVEIVDDDIGAVNGVIEVSVNASVDAGKECGFTVVDSREIQAIVWSAEIGASQFIHDLDASTV